MCSAAVWAKPMTDRAATSTKKIRLFFIFPSIPLNLLSISVKKVNPRACLASPPKTLNEKPGQEARGAEADPQRKRPRPGRDGDEPEARLFEKTDDRVTAAEGEAQKTSPGEFLF